MSNNTFLDNHIQQVFDFKNSTNKDQLSLEELKEIDLSLGMTEDEWNELMRLADDHSMQAKKHLALGDTNNAIEDATRAVQINPFIVNAYETLAKAYQLKYDRSMEPADIELAEKYANECLELDTQNSVAFAVLAKCSYTKQGLNSSKKQKKTIIYAIGGVLVALIILIFSISSGNTKSLENKAVVLQEQVHAAKAQLNNVIDRRNSLIPQLLSAYQNSPKMIKALQNLENQTNSVSDNWDENMSQQLQASESIKKLILQAPKSAKPDNIQLLLVQIEGAENRISVERKRYNEAVKQYNIFINTNRESLSDYEPLPYLE